MSRTLITVFLLAVALAWVGLLSLFQAVGGAPGKNVAAPDGSEATVKYVDQSRFHKNDEGEITLRLDIVKPDGEPVTNLPLKSDTVKVYEQDEPAKVLAFKGPGQQGINLILVIDHSGSMDGDKMGAARDAAVAALDELQVGRDSIAVIIFDDWYNVIFPFEKDGAGEVARLTDDSKRRCREQIQRVVIGGGTVIAQPTLEALRIFQEFAPSGSKLLMVMTDGEDDTLPPQIDTIVKHSEQAGVPVFTIGFGGEVGRAKDLLRAIATRTSAKYLEAPTADELKRLYPAQVQAATKEFSIVYQSPFPENDGQTRDVRVEIGDNLVATAQYQTKGIISGGSRKVSASGRATSGAGFKVLIFFGLLLPLGAALFLPLLIHGGSAPPVEGAMPPPLGGPMRGSTIRSPPPPGARPPDVRTAPRPPSPPPAPGKRVPQPVAPLPTTPQGVASNAGPPPMPTAPSLGSVAPPPVPSSTGTLSAIESPPPHTVPTTAGRSGGVSPPARTNMVASPPPPRATGPSLVNAKPASGPGVAPSAEPAALPPEIPRAPAPSEPPADATGKKRTIRPIGPPPPPGS